MSEKCIEIKSDLDKAKRVYRAAVDAVKKLDEGLKKKKAYREVFHQDAVGLRYKLREYCERLMFYNPMYYGRKAEEVLWRKVFYDIIQLIKKNRRHVRAGSSLETAYRTHLSSGSGYYYHLMFRLQRDFNLNLDNKIDFPLLPDNNPGRYSKLLRRKEVTPATAEWAMRAVHRCLICLGDIARYQQDFDSGMSCATAERFYTQALMLFPEIGMPHNQLGTLASSRYFHCEAAYHYIRCMASETGFEGAEGNLQRLFEKNLKRYLDIKQEALKPSSNPQEQCYHDLKAFFVRFLHLLKIFFDASKKLNNEEIQECCQRTLQSFNQCMFYEPVSYCDWVTEETLHYLEDDMVFRILNNEEIQECCQTTLQSFNQCMFYEPVSYCDGGTEETLHYLEDDMVFKIVVVCMATISILQKRSSKKVTAATAFLLALFSHILNHVVIRLQGSLYERENPNKILQSSTNQYDDCNGDDSETDRSSSDDVPLKNGHIKKDLTVKEAESSRTKHKPQSKQKPKPRQRNYRRRRIRDKNVVSDDSDMSELSDLSEGGNDMHDQYLTDESEEEPVGFYEDSDSDMSDSLMKSQEMDPGFATNPETDGSTNENVLDNFTTAQPGGSDLYPAMLNSSDHSKIWSDAKASSDSLANFSSELFSTSVPFLGANFRLAEGLENDVSSRYIPVPPGFASTPEARHVEELSQKLANFVIETDTDITATETEMSPETEVDENGSEENDKISSDAEKEAMHLQNVIDVIQGEGLMPVVKIVCDWMKCNSNVIMTCALSSQSVWYRLSVLLNFLPQESVFIQHEQCWLDELKTVLLETKEADWQQQIPLREDTNLTRFPPLKIVHETLRKKASLRLTDQQEREDTILTSFPPLKIVHETLRKKASLRLTDQQESFLRTCCLRQFGYFLSELGGLQFSYNEEKGMFIGPTQPTAAEDTQEVAMEKMAHTENRRNQLMRDMAQLRLQAEVSQLEGSLSTTDPVPFPPYLIPEASSLCHTLPLIKRLCQTNRSIMVIPLAVIDTLDVQKKESLGAREAIRWLEAEFRKGNRYIRAQKNSEKLNTTVPRLLRKRNRDAWCTLEILNLALYLSRQGGDFGAGTMIAILSTSDFSTIKHPLVKEALTSGLQEGVSVEIISEFVNKWSELLNTG